MSFWRKRQNLDQNLPRLHDAVETGNLSVVQKLLQGGADPNALDGRGATALHIAAARGHLEIAQLLVAFGADINFLIDGGGTPLMSASSCLRPRLVDFLLAQGASPNQKGEGGRVPLRCVFQPDVVAVSEQLDCIRLLLAHGARLDERNDNGSTPLMASAWFGNTEAVKLMLQAGANPILRDNQDRTAAILAFIRGHDELAHLLKLHAERAVQNADVSKSDTAP